MKDDLTCRHTLYPTLEDHDLVKRYPHVRGFAKDVFFLSHNHRENGGAEESASKYNTFEVGNSASSSNAKADLHNFRWL